jgi:hypothetical protein
LRHRKQKHLPATFPVRNSAKQGDTLFLWFMNFLTIYYSEGSSKPEVLKLNVAHNPLVSVDGFNLLGENVHTVKKRDKVRFSQHAYL